MSESKSRKRYLAKKQLTEWAKLVKDRDDHKCVICGSDDHLQSHHILEKKLYPEHKLNLDNGITLCAKHHTFGKQSAHHAAFFFINWLKENRPEQYEAVRIILLESLAKMNKQTNDLCK